MYGSSKYAAGCIPIMPGWLLLLHLFHIVPTFFLLYDHSSVPLYTVHIRFRQNCLDRSTVGIDDACLLGESRRNEAELTLYLFLQGKCQ